MDCIDGSLGLYGYYNSGMFAHGYDNQWFSGGSTWHAAETHGEWRYRDRYKIYTYYYKKTESKEADFDPTGQNNVSNVKKWVKFVNK